ncbi:unnamed protein product [Penicillium pancosmium]
MESHLSTRGEDFAKKKPTFLGVLENAWDPLLNPEGIVNLGLAENTLMHAEMKELMNSKIQVDSHSLTYGDGFSGSRKLKEAICHFLNKNFSPDTALLPSHITVTSGVSNALECSAWALFDQGDHVMVGRPYFNAFRSTFSDRAGVGLLEVEFGKVDPFGLAAIEKYEEALSAARQKGFRVKALLLCSPHNPLGRCYRENVLREYMRLCERHKLHLISDEIYALSVWESPDLPDPVSFKSILSINAAQIMDPSRVHVVWGLSKDFGATGLRIGCLISQSNGRLLEATEGFSLLNFPSSLADSLAASLLMNDTFTSHYLTTNRQRLTQSYDFVTTFLKSHRIPYCQSNAAFFLWIRLGAATADRKATDDEILAKLRNQKVYIAAGYAYASEESGWFRMVFAHPRDVLEEGLKRMLQALAS